ncbi:ankyrin repeat domain-containing protein 49-like [Halichondria panicea]|uniref:ankyrin repeat domain-containing protein 49-like n=1 Tax=Halichondria panicea TaxID=6063 RepID=UPI00312B51A4
MSDYLAVQLYYASSCGHDQEVLELLQRGAPPNNSDYYTREQRGYTPLHRACVNDNLRSAELLIKFGAIVAATDNDGCIPLHDVCLLNSKATAKLLLEHHRPTDIKSGGGLTAADVTRGEGYTLPWLTIYGGVPALT